jgi:site-specific DNA-methyltransferase (adenine-specific)
MELTHDDLANRVLAVAGNEVFTVQDTDAIWDVQESVENKLLLCDCVQGMRQLPNDLIDLTVTSPPYDKVRSAYPLLPIAKFKEVADELLRITKPGGVVVWVVQEQISKDGSQTGTSSEQRLYFKDIGFTLHDRLVMARFSRRSPTPRRYGLPLEEAFVLSKGKPTTVNLFRDRQNKTSGRTTRYRKRHSDGDFDRRTRSCVIGCYGYRSNVWCYATGIHTAKEEWVRKEHSALMVEKMAEDLILSYSKPDQLVFDPFCGLATTCKMALLNHRRYLGMEIDQRFYSLAERRMALAHREYAAKLAAMQSSSA